MLVDFMIIGAQKCGTTSLAAQLAEHKEVAFCRIKEPGFFNTTEDWQAQLPGYHALYRPLPGQLAGEASTMYTFFPEWRDTPIRLHQYNPDLKLIYLMRQPVERVISNYSHDLVRGIVKESPETVIFRDPHYINCSRYGMQIRPYLELFPRENLLLLLFEDYVADQAQALRQIANFLAIDPDAFADTSEVHAHKTVGETQLRSALLRDFVGSTAFDPIRRAVPAAIRQPIRRYLSNTLAEKPHFSTELKQMIWRLVEDDVTIIEQLMGRPLEAWRQGYRSAQRVVEL